MDTSVTRLRIRINLSRGFGSLTKHLYESVPDLFEEEINTVGFSRYRQRPYRDHKNWFVRYFIKQKCSSLLLSFLFLSFSLVHIKRCLQKLAIIISYIFIISYQNNGVILTLSKGKCSSNQGCGSGRRLTGSGSELKKNSAPMVFFSPCGQFFICYVCVSR